MTVALIVVDVQNDFADPDGNLYVRDAEFVPAEVNDLLGDYEHIVYTQDWHPPDTEHFEDYGGAWPAHCVRDTWGAQLHPDLNVVKDAYFIKKGQSPGEDGYSAFTTELDGEHAPTELDGLLTNLGVEEVHIVGVALDVCVKATALDAVRQGYETTVIVDATAGLSVASSSDALQEMHDAGVYIL